MEKSSTPLWRILGFYILRRIRVDCYSRVHLYTYVNDYIWMWSFWGGGLYAFPEMRPSETATSLSRVKGEIRILISSNAAIRTWLTTLARQQSIDRLWKKARERMGGRGGRQDDHGYVDHELAGEAKDHQILWNEVRIGPVSLSFPTLQEFHNSAFGSLLTPCCVH